MKDQRSVKRTMNNTRQPRKRVVIRNSGRYCATCGAFLGMTCDPFGRTACEKQNCNQQ